ncbi:MATE family efflux transporter [Paracidovorax wautersii]|uniref:MATE family multidrug resistance protein n=1 Tax=Paracidovorax wautersii TaxID=1177982 RepID=A0ABU1ID15_9BURK|nr:MATE family efflux transporter [Paracidovorax wautersii]MDR6215122.1 MATE family multidrug resistance protein [Paracidovorax wautersii]
MTATSERSIVLRHGATVLAGQLAVMAFGVADTIVAGRHSEEALAALSIGAAIFISVYVALMGLLQALLPVWAEQHGARAQSAIGASVRQSLYLWALASVAGMAVLLSPGAILRWTEVPQALRGDVERYLAIVAFALPPALLFRIYSTLNQALGRPQLVTWLQVGSLAIKVPLSIWFTFGGAGLAPQGVVGCAWATLAVNASLLALAIGMLRTQTMYRPLDLWRPLERPDPAQIGRFARLGVPAALSILVEVTSFTLMALFIARQGTLASAAHQIASNLTAVLYMVPLSLAIATSARVSYWRGAGDEAQARAVAWMGLRLAAGLGLALALLLLLGRAPLAGLYSSSAEVVALTAALLLWVAGYHVADALQTLCIFVLRSYGITLAPLVVYCVLLWGGGLAGGYLLAYRGLAGWGPTGSPAAFWAASAIALAVTAAAFSGMLLRVLRRRPVPAAGPTH